MAHLSWNLRTFPWSDIIFNQGNIDKGQKMKRKWTKTTVVDKDEANIMLIRSFFVSMIVYRSNCLPLSCAIFFWLPSLFLCDTSTDIIGGAGTIFGILIDMQHNTHNHNILLYWVKKAEKFLLTVTKNLILLKRILTMTPNQAFALLLFNSFKKMENSKVRRRIAFINKMRLLTVIQILVWN